MRKSIKNHKRVGFRHSNFMTTFESLNIASPILKALQEEGYTKPTPIQSQAIPIVLQGIDLLGCAQTGTGKTAAFSIPILQLMAQRPENGAHRIIKGLIVTPTRELAIQIGESLQAYGRHLPLRSTVIFGGVSQHGQEQILRRGVDILVATPGRLLDLMNQGIISLAGVRFFVLDEADRMLDMGFIHDVRKLIAVLPSQRQSLFFSATMPPEILKLASSILNNPQEVKVDPVSSTVEIIDQHVFHVDKNDKPSLLIHLLKSKEIKTALVFTRTKHGADKLVKLLLRADIKAEAIHGNKAQNARQRALANFKAQTTRVLVATDIAARGIDVDELAHVINFETTNVPETYVHRIGRTGRAGATGTALSFVDAEEMAYMRDIEKLIARKIPVVETHPYKAVHPTNVPKAAAAPKPSGNRRPGGKQFRPRTTQQSSR
jgi:ATP-dependent RNA helicase RhlE